MGTPASEQSPLPINLFDYDLPQDLIAQHPLDDRAGSRLLVLHRESGETEHAYFREIERWLKPGDLLVINDTRVLRARLEARRETGGRVEFLLLEPLPGGAWRSLAKPARRLRPGEKLALLDKDDRPTSVCLTVQDKTRDGDVIVDLPDFHDIEEIVGRVPLPHYITASLGDPERYQTVYARESGSAAAPTAGLHFTEDLLDRLETIGVEIARITLHVGQGTFQPVKVEDSRKHVMHSERFHVSSHALQQIQSACREGRRVIAVGTTSCRTLESIGDCLDSPGPIDGSTSLYISPGYHFRVVDGLVTNFHLPRSTLLMLVSAFAGRELVLRVYREAIARQYRFYSFGDAMLIL
jgi:S-adenosylmethionine:tRNA ribosyltransferase-isomerase